MASPGCRGGGKIFPPPTFFCRTSRFRTERVEDGLAGLVPSGYSIGIAPAYGVPIMPSTPRKKTGVYVEIDPALHVEFRHFAHERGNSFARELHDAMRRHIAYPPPTGPTPLPDAADAGKTGQKKSSRKSAKSP